MPSLWLLAAILGIVEGLTEFIPVSSSGHLIVVSDFLRFHDHLGSPDKVKVFVVVIQLGAILAVGYYFREKLWRALVSKDVVSSGGRLRTNLAVAFVPAVVFGLLFDDFITEHLFSTTTVAISLILGGIGIIWIERKSDKDKHIVPLEDMSVKEALYVGLAQVASLMPGVSRSGATIMGGLLAGMTRTAATEFSFLLSFPIMIAASGYTMLKHWDLLESSMIGALAVGFVLSFFSALAVVAWLIRFVQKHSFVGFGVYRIVFGAFLLILAAMGILDQVQPH
jgi:undecaprenyl-diphosphatase